MPLWRTVFPIKIPDPLPAQATVTARHATQRYHQASLRSSIGNIEKQEKFIAINGNGARIATRNHDLFADAASAPAAIPKTENGAIELTQKSEIDLVKANAKIQNPKANPMAIARAA